MKTISAIVIASCIVLLSCNTTITPPDIAIVRDRLSQSAKLATTEVIVSKMIKAKEGTILFSKWNFGKDATYLADVKFKIKFGIEDISRMKIRKNGNDIDVELPQIKILSLNYINSSYKVIKEHTTNYFVNQIDLEDIRKIKINTEIEVRNNIEQYKVLDTARNNTKKIFNSILQSLNFENININFAKEPQ
jgi:hypothetical protein